MAGKFDLGSQNYDKLAQVQKKSCQELCALISKHYHKQDKAETISTADIGCGTAGLSLELAAHFPKLRVHGYDISAPMLYEANKKADLANIDFTSFQDSFPETQSKAYQIIASNFALQWYSPNDLAKFFQASSAALDEQGLIAIALPCKGSFIEFKELYTKLDIDYPGLDFYSSTELIDLAQTQQLKLVESTELCLNEKFPSLIDFLRSLHQLGAQTDSTRKASELRKIITSYPSKNSFNISYQVHFLLFKKF